ncbi:hypothetical protein D3C78_1667900 [compost metagenome]
MVVAEQLAFVQIQAHLAFVQQEDALGDPFDFFQVVAGVDHRLAGCAQLFDGAEQGLAVGRIDAHRGFVEQVQVGRLQQADGEVQAALLAAGQAFGAA